MPPIMMVIESLKEELPSLWRPTGWWGAGREMGHTPISEESVP